MPFCMSPIARGASQTTPKEPLPRSLMRSKSRPFTSTGGSRLGDTTGFTTSAKCTLGAAAAGLLTGMLFARARLALGCVHNARGATGDTGDTAGEAVEGLRQGQIEEIAWFSGLESHLGPSEELQRLVFKLFVMEMERRAQACRSSGLGRRVLEASRMKIEDLKRNPVL